MRDGSRGSTSRRNHNRISSSLTICPTGFHLGHAVLVASQDKRALHLCNGKCRFRRAIESERQVRTVSWADSRLAQILRDLLSRHHTRALAVCPDDMRAGDSCHLKGWRRRRILLFRQTHPADHPASLEPQGARASGLSPLPGPQPRRAHVRQAQTATTHRHPLWRNPALVRELPQPRRNAPMAEVFDPHFLHQLKLESDLKKERTDEEGVDLDGRYFRYRVLSPAHTLGWNWARSK